MEKYKKLTKKSNHFTSLIETWKDIKGYENYYQVSSFGRVRSVDRFVEGKPGVTRLRKSQIISLKKSNTGYFSVGLCKDKIKKYFTVHRLVAEAFISNEKEKLTVNHIDGVKDNNNVSNLEWATHSEQMSHALKKNLINVRGNEIYSPSFKFRVKDFYERNSCSLLELARVFNISPRSAGRFVKFEKRLNTKISDEDVLKIKKMREDNCTLKQISETIGCGISQVHRIVKGLSRNLEYERE